MKLVPCPKCGQLPWYNYDKLPLVSVYCCKGTSTGKYDTNTAAEKKWNEMHGKKKEKKK